MPRRPSRSRSPSLRWNQRVCEERKNSRRAKEWADSEIDRMRTELWQYTNYEAPAEFKDVSEETMQILLKNKIYSLQLLFRICDEELQSCFLPMHDLALRSVHLFLLARCRD